jgi:hypothetical protein
MLRLLSSAVRTNLPSSTEENKKQTHTKKEYRPIKMNELKLCLVWSLRSGLDTRTCTWVEMAYFGRWPPGNEWGREAGKTNIRVSYQDYSCGQRGSDLLGPPENCADGSRTVHLQKDRRLEIHQPLFGNAGDIDSFPGLSRLGAHACGPCWGKKGKERLVLRLV